jgi:penicillin G amidase
VEYEFQGEWHPAEVRREEIRVRGRPYRTGSSPITRHGPIITTLLENESPVPLSLALDSAGDQRRDVWGHDPDEPRAHCLELREAMRTWNTPVLNVVYADVDGNMATHLAGKVPIRGQGEGPRACSRLGARK